MFIQLMDCQVKPGKLQEFKALGDQWEREEADRSPGYLGEEVVQDVRDPNHIIAIAKFESAEQARQNSNRPETNRFYQRMLGLLEHEPRFTDCELLQQVTHERPMPGTSAQAAYPEA